MVDHHQHFFILEFGEDFYHAAEEMEIAVSLILTVLENFDYILQNIDEIRRKHFYTLENLASY